MTKYDLDGFKKKIAPRDKKTVERDAASRFSDADAVLSMKRASEKEKEQPPISRVARKTFSIPESELPLIFQIKDKALNRKIVLADSGVVRLGLLVLSELSESKLASLSSRLEKMPLGRPARKKQQII